ncbi:MAG TPA: hypothetical protein VGM57_07170 [Pseudolabrys sp.]|jgi:sulfur transfer complex TusBCD TusB component (DsrH family)
MSSSKVDVTAVKRLEEAVDAVYAAANDLLNDGATMQVQDEVIQRLLTAGTKLYARKAELEQRNFSPLVPQSVTATDAVVVMGGMLDSVNLSTFDLSMWVDGRPRSSP